MPPLHYGAGYDPVRCYADAYGVLLCGVKHFSADFAILGYCRILLAQNTIPQTSHFFYYQSMFSTQPFVKFCRIRHIGHKKSSAIYDRAYISCKKVNFSFLKRRVGFGERGKIFFLLIKKKVFPLSPKASSSYKEITSFRRGCGCVCRRFRLRVRRDLHVLL